MNFSDITLFNVMRSKLGYLAEKQSVLAQNVANVDTPDYRAKDVKEPDFRKLAQSMTQSPAQKLPMTMTSAKHMTMPAQHSATFEIEDRENTYEQNPDGNNVVIEEEMMKAAETQTEYVKVLNLYRKTVDMFKTAIGRPGGSA